MSYSIYNSPYTTGNLTVGTGVPTGVSGYTYTSAGTSATDLIWGNTGTWATSPVTISQKATIELTGEDADIKINGESLKETLQAIQDALRIPNRIQQDAKLEEAFDELKGLRELYEQKVKEYREKQKVWSILNEKIDK